MGKKRRWIFPKPKKILFSRPHPIRRKMALKHGKMKAFFQKHNLKNFIDRGLRKMVEGIYTVSDKVRDKIAESTLALDNPFSVPFYEDRCSIQMEQCVVAIAPN